MVDFSPILPRNAPKDAWFSIPEGELGQITNALATMGHTLDPRKLLSLSGLRSLFDDTVESIKQEIGLATGNQTAWTVIHVTDPAKIAALQQAGLTAYKTKAAAEQHSVAQNRNVSQSGSALDLWHGLNLQTLLLRAGEVALGIVLLAVALSHLTGTDNVISGAAKTAGKFAML